METPNPWNTSPLNADASLNIGDARDLYRKRVEWFTRLVIAVGVFAIACSLFLPSLPSLGFLDVRAVLFAGVLLVAGVFDLKTGRVPIEITIALMGAAILRAFVLNDFSFVFAWVMLFGIYLLHILGGGDVKLLMGLFGLFPFVSFYYAFAIFWVITHYPLMLYWRLRAAEGRERIGRLGLWMILQPLHVIAGQMSRERVKNLPQELRETWPSDDDISRKGLRMAITISLGGILYLFLMTPVGLNWQWSF